MSQPQLVTIIWFVVLIGVFYFFLIRPQQTRTKKHKELVSELKVGDQVVTIGGIYGTIRTIKEKEIVLEIANGVRITVAKNAISRKQKED